MYERPWIFSAKSETVEWGNVLKLVRLAWNDSYLSVPTLAITSASSRCMHRLTNKLAAHFPYLTIITHWLTWKWCTGIISQFLSLSFVCPWLLLSFLGHFRKVDLAYCQSSSGHWDRKGHPRRAWEVECVTFFKQLNISLVLPVLWYTCLNGA